MAFISAGNVEKDGVMLSERVGVNDGWWWWEMIDCIVRVFNSFLFGGVFSRELWSGEEGSRSDEGKKKKRERERE